MELSPQRTYYSAHSTRERIKKSPRWDNEEGVASTVGTIMALLVFLTFMGLFTNQFLPVWMSDNESAHMSQVIQQFSTLKSQIDASVSNYANSMVAPSPVFVPIMLSSPGIPVFAGPTAGILQLTPEAKKLPSMFNLSYTWTSTIGGVTSSHVLDTTNDGHAGGDLDLYCPNRYYVEQHMVYEGGAIILNQTDGEFIIAGPQFSVTNTGSGGNVNRVVMLTQFTLLGKNNTIGGTGSKGVSADLLYSGTTVYENGNGSDLTVTITSKHGNAWASYFNRTLNSSKVGLAWNVDYTISKTLIPQPDRFQDYYVVVLTIHSVKALDHTVALINMSIGELGII